MTVPSKESESRRKTGGRLPPPGPEENLIIFLGTGGARVMVFKQILASGGIWLQADNTRILIDPGPGSLIQCTKRKLDPTKLDAIIITHRHLDHAAEVNTMIEAMTTGGFHPRGRLFAPRDALDQDPVVLQYVRSYLEGIEVLKEGGSYSVGNLSFTTPVRHQHSVETYGLVIQTAGPSIGLITDTRYFPELAQHYQTDVLIINTVLAEPRDIDHLSLPDAQELVQAIRPGTALLTHFGMTVWRAKPWEVAAAMSDETGVEVMAARDGMRFSLTKDG